MYWFKAASQQDLYIANKGISNEPTDYSSVRVPMLRTTTNNLPSCVEDTIAKSAVLVESFSPPPPSFSCLPLNPTYDVAKAYHPISLIDKILKVFLSFCSRHISFLAEKHNLLPPTQFRGRPGSNTTDAMLLVTHKIKDAWRICTYVNRTRLLI